MSRVDSLAALPEARAVTAAHATLSGVLADCAPPSLRTPRQREAVASARHEVRLRTAGFLRAYTDRLYDAITAGRTRFLRLAEVCDAAATAVPGLAPTMAESDAEQNRPPEDKEGLDVDQSILISHLLRSSTAGSHLLEAMRRPTPRALRLLPEFERTGHLSLDSVYVQCSAGVAHLTMQRDDCLNAEDNQQVEDMETAVDLILLASAAEVGVIRGGVMSHPRYAGRRVFSSGINLKSLHAGRISFTGFLLGREMGYLAKIIHGLTGVRDHHWDRGAVQKPWLAAVDSFAIGGGAQLMLACDRVIVERDAYFTIPAAREGIIPGVAALRLGRLVGARQARQIILADGRVAAADPVARLLFDEVCAPDDMAAAIAAEASRLASPAVVANRRMLNLADESQESFREFLAEFTVQQAGRLYAKDVLNKVSRFTTSAS
ncbi:(3,5-dihydroxyphenyl)acetyl-CoA 1,2-dioxygenase DpgC [Actinophytocola algeriensis]|uniref:Thioesterase DpgC n=1 Tax=Actinophytocola algeriensis TaxID=1768010 RepID=A0A7W7Q3H9_9PSEU|nr:(3,5-dihydroxyphenyl)acetyl-CoA 1,2-dioxygenase DpgC [Actinophytocola algeriensis]MBB4906247.1 thioesterase DpgC [Actinophytocola algeriensis]MBE1472068.1 thioesterase DpgC [Actinophytocola algeriensis]